MITTNPFAELSKNIPSISMQLFVIVMIVVLSTPKLFTLISSANTFDGININDIENNVTAARKIPLFEDLFIVFFPYSLLL